MATHWTLEDLYRGIMQSWIVLVGTIVLFTVAGVGVFLIYPQKYTAEAQHTVEPISVLSSGSSFNTVNMETERVVATSTSVLTRAVEGLDDTTVEGLRANTTIEVPRNSQVLLFQVTANTPDLAAERANALATAYGEQRTENARSVVEQTTEELSVSIQQLQTLAESQAPGSSERAATELQLQALLDQQARLTATPFYSGTLVTPADAPQQSNRPSILVFVAAGLFLGILVGAIAALIASRVRSGPGSAYKRAKPEGAPNEAPPLPDGAEAPGPTEEDDSIGEPSGTDDGTPGPVSATHRR
ncbi:Wzz/FepE/Etk N-terminal domain-containing protein [Microbacterium sp. M28]|uniref:YveK family protein n=1 Tax=Microbacterium sp. M28 TaxID=2962064 RepID=UPI0021F421A4|nr:Wzz/FepE/Etk N-terminal domain-containing protein [Microbacterium sp. M28]UYO96661.1 Wzz/FepE/Etk N-terminal domain-containing protein [Microbacterium sp. M28]